MVSEYHDFGQRVSPLRLVFGSSPADLSGWDDQEEDLLSPQDTPASEQFAQQWQLRMMPQEAALKEVANIKLRRLPAYNKTSNCTDVAIGDSVRFYKAPNRNGQTKWRGLASILDIDGTGVAVRDQGQTFQATRYCARM